MQLAKRQARRVSRQGFKPHLGGAFTKTSHTARTIKRDGVALGRHDVGQRDLARELRRHRPDLERHGHGVLIFATGLYLVAAGDAKLENLRVIQRLPGLLLGHGQGAAGLHFHDGFLRSVNIQNFCGLSALRL